VSGIGTAFTALRHRDFRWLWAGTFCATGGQWIQQATLGWVAYQLTGSGTLLGAVLGMRAIPMLLLAPVSGLVAERYDRRRALAASQLLVCAISLLLATAIALNRLEVWHLFAFTSLAGVGAVFDRTLRSALVFNVVPRTEVAHAVALNSIAFSVMRAIGPGVAGVLIARIGPAWNFALQALLYLAVGMNALMIRAQHEPQQARPRASAWIDLEEGARFVLTDPVARMMVVMGLVPPLLLIPSFSALMPVFAVNVFATGPEGLGLLLSAVGVGGVAGGVLAAWLTQFDRVGLVQSAAVFAFALALTGFALSPTMHVALLFLVAAGTAEMVHATTQVTTLQMSAPPAMRGRVASLLPVFPAFISIGSLTSGTGADLLGPRAIVVALAAAAILVVIGAWLRSRALREVRLSGLVAQGGVKA
jgi:MFS family permease